MYHLSKERARYKKQKQKKNLTQFLNSLNKGMCLDIFKKKQICCFTVLLFYCFVGCKAGRLFIRATRTLKGNTRFAEKSVSCRRKRKGYFIVGKPTIPFFVVS